MTATIRGAKTIVVASIVVGSLLVASTGSAQVWSHSWPDDPNTNVPTYRFKVDAASFTDWDSRYGPDFTENQAVWWIRYAANLWTRRTGTKLEIDYDGKLSDSDPMCAYNIGATEHDNGVNEIVAMPHPDPDDYGGRFLAAQVAKTSGDTYIESDICVFIDGPEVFYADDDHTGNFDTWAVRSEVFPSADHYDLVAILVHEFGHAIGAEGSDIHEPGTVMEPDPEATEGTTRGRYPYGFDVEGLLSLYNGPVERTRYWREWNWDGTGDGQWGSRNQFWGNSVIMYSTGDVGYSSYNGKWKVVSTSINYPGSEAEGAKMHFTRNNHPLGVDRWYDTSLETTTWRPPGITGSDDGQGRWLAAWTNSRDKFGKSCAIKLAWSNSAFGGYWRETLDQPCTNHQPTVGFVENDGVFVVVWGRDNGNYDVPNDEGNDSIWAMSYVTWAQEWTAPQPLVSDAMGSPSISCRQYRCDLTYLQPDSIVPQTVVRQVDVTSDGELSIVGDPQIGDRYLQLRLSVEDSAGDPAIDYEASFLGQHHTAGATPAGSITTHQEAGYPEAPFDWDTGTQTTRRHRGDVAGNTFRSPPYLFTVDTP